MEVVHNDIVLPISRIKIKLAGGCSEHNGIRYMDNCVRNGYWRSHTGVSRPSSGREVSGHVLSRLKPNEAKVMEDCITSLFCHVIEIASCEPTSPEGGPRSPSGFLDKEYPRMISWAFLDLFFLARKTFHLRNDLLKGVWGGAKDLRPIIISSR